MKEVGSIWIAWHEYERDGCPEYKLIGVFSTRERAEAAIDARRGKPGFIDHPNGFAVMARVVDRDTEWLDGFVTVH